MISTIKTPNAPTMSEIIMDSWLEHYLSEILSLDLDDTIIEYYTGFLGDKEISDEEKTEILRAAFRDSKSSALSVSE